MEIVAQGLGKRFNFNWIFSKLNLHLLSGSRCALLGANGSGKSTLLQIISGAALPSTGELCWKMADQEINAEQVYRFVSIAAPYLDLIEDFTLHEHLAFHFSLKQARESRPVNELVELSTLKKSAHKPIRFFSSGMKQRVRLLLAICSNTPLLLLDEPLSNLDEEGAAWYEKMIAEFGNDRTIIVASNNQLREYNFCTQQISLNQTY